jgi:MFS-type transporter involved in bile tolerance (Atg22 family)
VVGLLGVGQRGGQAIMPYPLVAIMALMTWREAWFALAAMVVLLQVVPSFVFLRRRPEDYGLNPDGDVIPDDETPEELQKRSRETAEDSWSLAEVRRSRTLWLLIIAQGGVVLCLNATNLHAAAHLQDQGLSLTLAATVTTIFAAASAVTVLPWGILMERLHTRTLGMMATAMLIVAMVLLLMATNIWIGAAFGLVYGTALGAWTVVSRMLFANYFGRRHFGSIRGFAAPIMAVVNPFGPLLAAWFRDTRGEFDLAFIFFAGVFTVSFVAFLMATPPKRRVEAPVP